MQLNKTVILHKKESDFILVIPVLMIGLCAEC